jgi:hypothetical protein
MNLSLIQVTALMHIDFKELIVGEMMSVQTGNVKCQL